MSKLFNSNVTNAKVLGWSVNLPSQDPTPYEDSNAKGYYETNDS